ncbi:MAG: hypothetical protein R6V39_03225, partial [Desulfovibrionales bacterium]
MLICPQCNHIKILLLLIMIFVWGCPWYRHYSIVYEYVVTSDPTNKEDFSEEEFEKLKAKIIPTLYGFGFHKTDEYSDLILFLHNKKGVIKKEHLSLRGKWSWITVALSKDNP